MVSAGTISHLPNFQAGWWLLFSSLTLQHFFCIKIDINSAVVFHMPTFALLQMQACATRLHVSSPWLQRWLEWKSLPTLYKSSDREHELHHPWLLPPGSFWLSHSFNHFLSFCRSLKSLVCHGGFVKRRSWSLLCKNTIGYTINRCCC